KPAVPENPISDPAGLIRIGTMIQALRDEVRGVDLDEATRERLTGIYRRSVEAIRESLSPELRKELDGLTLPFPEGIPTEDELRVAQAQLAGWLEGLFRGIQAAVFTQQMTAQRQLEGMRAPGDRAGTYL